MNRKKPVVLAIIGGGLSSLCMVERLLAWAAGDGLAGHRVELNVFDSGGGFGSGTHYTSQSATNHLNRAADQVSFGADDSHEGLVSHLLPATERWTLFQWCRAQYAVTGDERYHVSEQEWVDRNLLGEAAEAIFSFYVERLKALGVGVVLHNGSVNDIEESSRRSFHIEVSDVRKTYTVAADFIILCTGHGSTHFVPGGMEEKFEAHARSGDGARYIDDPYPLESLDPRALEPGSTVGLLGMGLAALDVILKLTAGRGGYFIRSGRRPNSLSYVASGFEPRKIYPFSDSGVFNFARAWNEKMNNRSLFHSPIYFHSRNIEELRQSAGRVVLTPTVGRVNQLDFELHVLPLIILEMALVYYGTLFGREFRTRLVHLMDSRVARFVGRNRLAHETSTEAVAELLDPVLSYAAATSQSISMMLAGPVARYPHDLCKETRAATIAFLKFRFGQDSVTPLLTLDDTDLLKAAVQLSNNASPWGHDASPDAHAFDWQSMIDPLVQTESISGAERAAIAKERFHQDILDAHQGNLSNARKAAIDGVWRDLRSTIRYAVEFAGLTAESHEVFIRKYMRISNRITVGTSLKVMEQIGALIRNGIVDLSVCRAPSIGLDDSKNFLLSAPGDTGSGQTVTTLVNARIPRFHLERMRHPLFQNLLRRGLLRIWSNPSATGADFRPGGIDIAPGSQLAVRANGRVHTRFAVLGPPTEGPLFFRSAAVRPYSQDPLPMYADRLLSHIFCAADQVGTPASEESSMAVS
jgi:hypothetical protein